MTAPLLSEEARRESDRIDAAQAEWTRWKRVNGVAAAGFRATAAELQKLANSLGAPAITAAINRHAAQLMEHAYLLDGEDWLKSPLAMAEKRRLSHEATS